MRWQKVSFFIISSRFSARFIEISRFFFFLNNQHISLLNDVITISNDKNEVIFNFSLGDQGSPISPPLNEGERSEPTK